MIRAIPPRLPIWLLLAACFACSRAAPPAAVAAAATPPPSLCPVDGDSFLRARLRGALDADVDWSNGMLVCDGGVRPDGSGVRATFAGPAPGGDGAAPRSLRFIFGIGLADSAPGAAEALPTNLTVILEGEQTLFSTQGDDKCAVEIVSRRPLVATQGMERLQVRGYCTEPASDAGGERRLLVSTFEFAGVIRMGELP